MDRRSASIGADARHGVVKWLGLVGWIFICFAAAAAGAPFAPDDWYAQLNRPAFTPPDYLFGPVRTVLYLCMAVASMISQLTSGAVVLLHGLAANRSAGHGSTCATFIDGAFQR